MLAPTGSEPIFPTDPISAAEAEIRAYLLKHRVARRAGVGAGAGNGGMLIFFLGIYAALACAAAITLFCVNRIDCDPMFTDRGLTAACRNWSEDVSRIAGTGDTTRWSPSNSL